jgi:F0F1-type ATP synthase assembly protein I
MLFGSGKKDVDPKERALWGDLMALGMTFPIAIALGFFLGRWIGGRLGHPKVGMAIGLAWGVGAGFWELYKVTVKLDRLDRNDAGSEDKNRKDGDHGPDC